jgi:hypothetical protein
LRRRTGTALLWVFLVRSTSVQAHSASDAYLSLTLDRGARTGQEVAHGQWDIALRDLDFVLRMDDDGDGRLTWGEVRRHQAAIERYAYPHLKLSADPANHCEIKPIRQLIDNHADGAYAALFFDLVCERVPAKVTLAYDMFFAIDPSHRAILVVKSGINTASAVLSPQNLKIDLPL